MILEEKYKEAVEAYDTYIFSYLGSLDERQRREAVARDYYDYLLALSGKGDNQKFSKILDELLTEIPDEPGNLLWKAKAKQILKE